jgi:hypothetical protein
MKRSSLLSTAAQVVTVVGGIVSVGLLLYLGRRNKSIVLRILFSIWVLTPFLLSLLLNLLLAKRASLITQKTLQVAMFIVSLISLVLYSDTVLRPPVSQPVARFVALPVISSIVIILVVGAAILISRYVYGRA